jgi:HAE1 family hydrophobic/amphiphilic exporter-1
MTVHRDVFPVQDTGFTAQNASFPNTVGKVHAVARVISQDPDVAAFGMFIDASSSNHSNLNIALKPKDQGRKDSATAVIARLRPRLAQVVGAQTSCNRPRTSMSAAGRARRSVNTPCRIPTSTN